VDAQITSQFLQTWVVVYLRGLSSWAATRHFTSRFGIKHARYETILLDTKRG
jgi:hypothetical protein